MTKRLFIALTLLLAFGLGPLYAQEGELSFQTTGSPSGNGSRLFRFFIDKFQPETMTMVLDKEPDEAGHVRRVFIDVRGARIDGMRIDHISVEALDTLFTPIATWEKDGVEVSEMLMAYSDATLLEKDINEVIQKKTFGKGDDHWKRLSIDFREGGIHAEGNYVAQFLFTFNILIEIDGVLDIVNHKAIWIDDYTVRVNKRDLPKGLTERAISKIQPILDLGKFVFPLRLHRIEQTEDRVTMQSRILPHSFEGIIYTYKAEMKGKD